MTLNSYNYLLAIQGDWEYIALTRVPPFQGLISFIPAAIIQNKGLFLAWHV